VGYSINIRFHYHFFNNKEVLPLQKENDKKSQRDMHLYKRGGLFRTTNTVKAREIRTQKGLTRLIFVFCYLHLRKCAKELWKN